MKIPFYSLDATHNRIRDEITEAFRKVFESNCFILGERVEQFEKEYAAYNSVQHCAGISNGLDALQLCLKTLGIGAGDEVIVPSNTFIATVLAVSAVGAKPVLAEPQKDTFNIDPANLEAVITSRTKAIIPVHLFGQCCEMTAILNLAGKHGLFIIEDNAQSQGSTCLGKPAGSFGHINATSFYPGKNLGALGDAGAITTNDSELAEKVKMLRNYGSRTKYDNEVIGYNMRLDELQAAFLSVKLKYLPGWITERQQIAAWYHEALKNMDAVVLPVTATGVTHVYHQYVIRTKQRNQLQRFLEENEIDTLVHYPVPPHLQMAYRELGFKKGDFPVAEEMAETSLSLPVWPGMTRDNVLKVAAAIGKFYGR